MERKLTAKDVIIDRLENKIAKSDLVRYDLCHCFVFPFFFTSREDVHSSNRKLDLCNQNHFITISS